MYNNKITITESDRNEIRKQYGLECNEEYVFDFVLTENNKYLIIMDQVFVNGDNGKSIGSIWENTYIFDEILNENKDFNNSLNEDVKKTISSIKWSKSLVKECLNSTDVITESWWDDVKSGANNLLNNIGSASLNLVKTVFNKGVIPLLRWIRRGLYTGVGIVVDVVASILAAKSNAIVWIVISLLDIYEIMTNDFDPQDPDRKQMPFFFLVADLIGAVFTGAAAFTVKKAAPIVAREGLSKFPKIAKYFSSFLEKIPGLKNTLTKTLELLGSKLGPKASGFVSTVMKSIESVLNKASQFISSLLSKKVGQATVQGVKTLGVTKGLEKGLNYTGLGKKLSGAVSKAETGMQNMFNYKQKLDPETVNIVSNYIARTNI